MKKVLAFVLMLSLAGFCKALDVQNVISQKAIMNPTINVGSFVVVSEIIDLKKEELVLKEQSTLIVNKGGGFINGKIKGKHIKINAEDRVIFGESVQTSFEETNLKSSWFGDFKNCITNNKNCSIEVLDGEYEFDNHPHELILNSLKANGKVIIKHSAPFTIGDNVTIQGIEWDGQNRAAFWMYCQPNNLSIIDCSFKNYYGKATGIIYWSHSEVDTEGLYIDNCTFGKLGVTENGIIGDMDGSSFAIRTYRCKNITIKNCLFKEQYGTEDSDAIKLEGASIYDAEKFPISNGEEYRYDDVNAIIEGNIFVNVPKSPVKIFGSGVRVRNNKILALKPVTALARMFRSQNIVIENNIVNSKGSLSNILEIWTCQNVSVYKNFFTSFQDSTSSFIELVRIERCKNVTIDKLSANLQSSSNTSRHQAFVRLSGKDITVKNSNFRAPYTYYCLFAPWDIDGLVVERCDFQVTDAIQYAILINNTMTEPQGKCIIRKCKFDLSQEKIDNATSYCAIYADDIILNECKFSYNKDIVLGGKSIKVCKSDLFDIQVRRASKVKITDCRLQNCYTPIIIGDVNNDLWLDIDKIRTNKVELALIRFNSFAPYYISLRRVHSPELDEKHLFRFDNNSVFQEYIRKHDIKQIYMKAVK